MAAEHGLQYFYWCCLGEDRIILGATFSKLKKKMVESFIHSCMEEKLPDGDINADGNIEFL